MTDVSYQESKGGEQNASSLELKKYNHWRDWLHNLQLGNAKLPQESPEASNAIGNWGYIIGQRTVLELREGGVDNNGSPIILNVDKVPDEEVVSNATQQDLKQYLARSVLEESKDKDLESSIVSKTYAIASVALGSTLLKKSVDEIISLYLREIEESSLSQFNKDALADAINNVEKEKVSDLINYLVFSQSQMTREESGALSRGFEPKKQLGEEPLNIGGKEYSFSGSSEPIATLDEKDLDLLLPLEKANTRSRQDMVEQALETAYQILGLDREKKPSPPLWWMNGESLEGIRSNQVLIYLPHLPEGEIRKLSYLFRKLYENQQTKNAGWALMTISKDPNETPSVTKFSKLLP